MSSSLFPSLCFISSYLSWRNNRVPSWRVISRSCTSLPAKSHTEERRRVFAWWRHHDQWHTVFTRGARHVLISAKFSTANEFLATVSIKWHQPLQDWQSSGVDSIQAVKDSEASFQGRLHQGRKSPFGVTVGQSVTLLEKIPRRHVLVHEHGLSAVV